jgi:hypothetical protein
MADRILSTMDVKRFHSAPSGTIQSSWPGIPSASKLNDTNVASHSHSSLSADQQSVAMNASPRSPESQVEPLPPSAYSTPDSCASKSSPAPQPVHAAQSQQRRAANVEAAGSQAQRNDAHAAHGRPAAAAPEQIMRASRSFHRREPAEVPTAVHNPVEKKMPSIMDINLTVFLDDETRPKSSTDKRDTRPLRSFATAAALGSPADKRDKMLAKADFEPTKSLASSSWSAGVSSHISLQSRAKDSSQSERGSPSLSFTYSDSLLSYPHSCGSSLLPPRLGSSPCLLYSKSLSGASSIRMCTA